MTVSGRLQLYRLQAGNLQISYVTCWTTENSDPLIHQSANYCKTFVTIQLLDLGFIILCHLLMMLLDIL